MKDPNACVFLNCGLIVWTFGYEKETGARFLLNASRPATERSLDYTQVA